MIAEMRSMIDQNNERIAELSREMGKLKEMEKLNEAKKK